MPRKYLVAVAAALEALMGLVLMIDPPVLTQLLLGADVSGSGLALGRVAGFSFVGLGLACWPGPEGGSVPALRALFAYNILITIYLVFLGINGVLAGPLLWPAAVLHATFTLLFARAWWLGRPATETQPKS